MSRAKQSAYDRAKRLSDRRCPIHGIGMSQVGLPLDDDDGHDHSIASCPRRDCSILANGDNGDGRLELLPEWAHLIERQTQQ